MMKASDKLVQHDGNYGLPHLDKTKPRLAYENVDSLKDAPESVKKIFSIEFGERRDLTDAWKRELVESVNKHKFDTNSLQSKSMPIYSMVIIILIFSCMGYMLNSSLDNVSG